MNLSEVDFFERVHSQIGRLYDEFGGLAKGKPDNPVNKFKLGILNEKLRDANTFLTASFKPLVGFKEFDEDSLPTNSDVLIVLSQYLDALESWRSANIEYDKNDGWFWKTDERKKIKAAPPTKFKRVR